MTAQHTPGPWFIANDPTFVYAPNMPMESQGWCNRFHAHVEGGYDETGNKKTTVAERIANARLIAAAPELLDALRKCLVQLPIAAASWNEDEDRLLARRNVEHVLKVIDETKAAIAKATWSAE